MRRARSHGINELDTWADYAQHLTGRGLVLGGLPTVRNPEKTRAKKNIAGRASNTSSDASIRSDARFPGRPLQPPECRLRQELPSFGQSNADSDANTSSNANTSSDAEKTDTQVAGRGQHCKRATNCSGTSTYAGISKRW